MSPQQVVLVENRGHELLALSLLVALGHVASLAQTLCVVHLALMLTVPGGALLTAAQVATLAKLVRINFEVLMVANYSQFLYF